MESKFGYICLRYNVLISWTPNFLYNIIFIGKNCEIDIDECASNPCQHGATCEDAVNSFNCICMPGFAGTSCEINIDECEVT